MPSAKMGPDNIMGLVVGVVGLFAAVPSLALFIRWLRTHSSGSQTQALDTDLENNSSASPASPTGDNTDVSMDNLMPPADGSSTINTSNVQPGWEERIAFVERLMSIRIQPAFGPYHHYLDYAPVLNIHPNVLMGTSTISSAGPQSTTGVGPVLSQAERPRQPSIFIGLAGSVPDSSQAVCVTPSNNDLPPAPFHSTCPDMTPTTPSGDMSAGPPEDLQVDERVNTLASDPDRITSNVFTNNTLSISEPHNLHEPVECANEPLQPAPIPSTHPVPGPTAVPVPDPSTCPYTMQIKHEKGYQ